jgi:bifunctional DNase/RNase|tara:strand:+ start:330 stop:809 length:480 start_codon:yes stop_codon:yes gene_type:complete
MSDKVFVEVSSIRLEEETETPIMLLQKPNTNEVLPIWIGTIEAVSIAYAQEGFVHPRPQTHDLLLNILDSLNAKILDVTITDIHDKTYFAEINVSTHEGELTLSSRPSDAIALALRSSAEIFVDSSVFNNNYIEIYDEDNVDIEEFTKFINDVTPEDFS